MHKGTSQNSQSRLSRVTVNDVMRSASGTYVPSKTEQSETLRHEIARLEGEIVKLPRGSAARKRLGQRKHELQVQRAAAHAVEENRGPKIDYIAITHAFRQKAEVLLGKKTVDDMMQEATAEWAARNQVDLKWVFRDCDPGAEPRTQSLGGVA